MAPKIHDHLTPDEKEFLLDRLEADCIQDVLRDTFDGITDKQANYALERAIRLVEAGGLDAILDNSRLIKFTIADAYDGSTLIYRTEDMVENADTDTETERVAKKELRKVKGCIKSLAVKLAPLLKEHADTPDVTMADVERHAEEGSDGAALDALNMIDFREGRLG